MSDSWHIQYADGRQEGPLTVEQIKELAKQNKLTTRDMIWSPRVGDWRPAGELQQLINQPGPVQWQQAPMAVTPVAQPAPIQPPRPMATPSPSPAQGAFSSGFSPAYSQQKPGLNYAGAYSDMNISPLEARLLKGFAQPIGSPLPDPLNEEHFKQLKQTGRYMRRVLFWGNVTLFSGAISLISIIFALVILVGSLGQPNSRIITGLNGELFIGIFIIECLFGIGLAVLMIYCGINIKKLRTWPFVTIFSLSGVGIIFLLIGLAGVLTAGSSTAVRASAAGSTLDPSSVMVILFMETVAAGVVLGLYIQAFLAAKKVLKMPRWCVLTLAALNL